MNILNSFINDQGNSIIRLPLLKNPLISSDIDNEKNIVSQFSLLEKQIANKSTCVIKYANNDMPTIVPKNSLLVLGTSQVNVGKLVAYKDNCEFKLGILKPYGKIFAIVDGQANLIPIKDRKNKNIFSVDLILKYY